MRVSLCSRIPEVFRATKTLVGKRGKGKHLETLRRGRRGQQTLPKCRRWVMDGMCRGHTQVQRSCHAPRLPRAPWWPPLGAQKLPSQQGCGQTGGLGLLLPPCPAQQGAGRSGSELDATFQYQVHCERLKAEPCPSVAALQTPVSYSVAASLTSWGVSGVPRAWPPC